MIAAADTGIARVGQSAIRPARLTWPQALLTAALLLVLVSFSPPLFIVERYSLTGINKPVILALIGALAVLLLRRFSVDSKVAEMGYLMLLQATLILVLAFVHSFFGYGFDAGYFSVSFQILASLAIFAILANAGQAGFFAKFWVNLHLVIGAMGLVVFVAGIAINLEPLGTFLDRPYYDFGLAYTNVFYQVGGLKLIRVAGFYDEPGTFAFYMTFALLLAKLYDMPRWKQTLLIVFGLTSISMAFIVVVAFWVLLSMNRRGLKYVVFLLALVPVALSNVNDDVRDYAYRMTIDRFNVAKSGDRLLKGDSRTPIMKENYQAFLEAPFIGHGLHYEEHVGHKYQWSFIANPMAPFATHGLIGAVVMNLHVLVLFLLLVVTPRLSGRDKAFFILVLAATLAQRPITVNGLGYLLLILMIFRLDGGDQPHESKPAT